MSFSQSSCTNGPDIGNVYVGEESADRSSPDRSVKERVLKEVGLTSTTFIGPALPGETNKSDIDDKLSEFYKELEKADTLDDASGNPGKQEEGFVHPPTPLKMSRTKETLDVSQERLAKISQSEEADSYGTIGGGKQSSWPHWYENEPYYSRRPRQGLEMSTGGGAYAQNHWRHPHPRHRVPNQTFHRPPFHHPAPPFEFLNPRNPPLSLNPIWNDPGMSNQYQEDSTFCSFPPPNDCSFPPLGFYRNSKYPSDRDEREKVNIGWPRDGKEELSQLGERYDRCQRFDSENEQWEQQHHCRPPDNTRAQRPSLVLILMRGLPGSGKSTLARCMFV